MAALVTFLAENLGLDPDRVDLLSSAALMHDVGKIGTPDEVLRKPGPFRAGERSVMEQHSLNGYEILADSKGELLRLAATIALTHHERFDGTGHPNGLAGEDIPLEGRITAVAEVFDALLSDRVYRPALRMLRLSRYSRRDGARSSIPRFSTFSSTIWTRRSTAARRPR